MTKRRKIERGGFGARPWVAAALWAAILALFTPEPSQLRAQTENPVEAVTVSAASYLSPAAPESIISIFGTNLATATATAVLDPDGSLPLDLAGTRLEINARPAGLIFVSPTQINAVVPGGAELGIADVVARSGSGMISRGIVELQRAAPGLFAVDSSGRGPGAILNGVTFAKEPFQVETIEIAGDDQRTRLAVFATGLRLAESAEALITDDLGRTFRLEVEYAARAPGFVGLDQVNLVLPAELDGAKTCTLAVISGERVSNSVTFTIARLPSSRIHVSSLTLNPSTVRAGGQATATVRLNGWAPRNGTTVTLGSSRPVAEVPFNTLVAPEAVEANFAVRSTGFGAPSEATINASAGGARREAVLTVRPSNAPNLVGFSISPTRVRGGKEARGRLTLSSAALAGGETVQLRSADPVVRAPSSVVVPFGQSSFEFALPTEGVATARPVAVTATYSSVSREATIEVRPPVELTLAPQSVTGGESAVGTVTLAEGAPSGGASIGLRSSTANARPPSFLLISEGQNSATFTVATSTVTSPASATLTASFQGNEAGAVLTIRPANATGVDALSISPAILRGGTAATATVRLAGTAPSGGVFVELSSADRVVASAPSFVTVPGGQSSATFTVSTSPVTAARQVRITATAGGRSASVLLTVN